jgi:hypothetical protein
MPRPLKLGFASASWQVNHAVLNGWSATLTQSSYFRVARRSGRISLNRLLDRVTSVVRELIGAA